MAKMYTLAAVQNLISKYAENDGEIIELIPGTLGYGLTICYGEGLKTAVINEVYINPWSSGHTIRMYNKMPEKYVKMIEKHEEEVA